MGVVCQVVNVPGDHFSLLRQSEEDMQTLVATLKSGLSPFGWHAISKQERKLFDRDDVSLSCSPGHIHAVLLVQPQPSFLLLYRLSALQQSLHSCCGAHVSHTQACSSTTNSAKPSSTFYTNLCKAKAWGLHAEGIAGNSKPEHSAALHSHLLRSFPCDAHGQR